jgi:Methyltransferase domain
VTVRGALGRLRRRADEAAQRPLARAGYHLTRRNFYSPIPVVEEIPASLWDGPSELPGVDLRVEEALALLNGPLLPYLSEFRPPLGPTGPGEFWLHNGGYESVDADTLYAMLRHLKPPRVYELGSGSSSHVIQMAARVNARDEVPLEHTIFDPFPFQNGTMGPVTEAAVHAVRTEDIDPARFANLRAGDVLFIDTTHTVRTGGDVTHIFLEVLPRIAVGVTIHVHDIFLPYEYPRDWVVDERRAWAEQYLLQAFLVFNTHFEVVMPNYAVAQAAPDTLKELVPSFDPATVRPGGFWITRVS